MRFRLYQFLFLALFSLNGIAGPEAGSTIKLATTTSTENSGLLGYLLPKFQAATGYQVHVIAVGTGKALRMGTDGDVDAVLVHAPKAEETFVKAGYGVKRHPVMYNDFVLVGPADDAASISRAKDLGEALSRIHTNKSLFISRGDDSGTHKKERSLWQDSRINPAGEWYREIGQGMGKTLQMAGELDAYTLTDRGTWLAYQDKSPLKLLFEGDQRLFNPYGIIAVNPARYPDTNQPGAQALIAWLTSLQGQDLIGSYKLHGSLLFTPSAIEPIAASR